MTSYLEMTREELLEEKERLEAEYKKVKALGLNLNMARGKPSPEQLDLSMGMFDLIDSKTALISGGTDCRNYGDVDGGKGADGGFYGLPAGTGYRIWQREFKRHV